MDFFTNPFALGITSIYRHLISKSQWEASIKDSDMLKAIDLKSPSSSRRSDDSILIIKHIVLRFLVDSDPMSMKGCHELSKYPLY